jgi:hypothetical protein
MKFKVPWRQLQTAYDIGPYIDFYKNFLNKVKGKLFVEICPREGVLSRIILETLGDDKPFKLVLVDETKNQNVDDILINDHRVVYLQKSYFDAVNDFADRAISFLHIDPNNHSTELAHDLFKAYEPKLTRNAVVIFHDCTPYFGVHKFVETLVDNPQWVVEYCTPAATCAEGAPAAVVRVK